ncbi:hypothetical protein OnM2_043063 [Erysiphe neolycopersici]|uniref:Uncharacterized protein n=1 Tax=Erysiphe neolycopersici TaxID=212602 RepID=A0A420HV12_9PEZI|nr:hypothetical protein OnM2_043063 [Erysiphe neolycopersici]
MATSYYPDKSNKSLINEKEDFEPLEWDPNFLDISSPDESPEPVAINPQPVTYTTVGSLVDPKAILQFATPSRIQREGANRKPLMSLLANRPFDSVFQSYGSPPLKPSYSMRYIQRSSQTFSDKGQKLPSNLETNSSAKDLSSVSENPRNLLIATHQEENARSQFNGMLTIFSENKTIKNQYSGLDSNQYSFRDTANKDLGGKVTGSMIKLHTCHQSLEKMQTLQRLSRFNNPIQEWAQNKLSEFAVNKNQVSQKNSPSSASSHDSILYNYGQVHENQIKYPELEDLKFRYSYPSADKGLYKTHSQFRGNRNLIPSNISSTRSLSYPYNYPQPLTAGPPGQRNSSLSYNQPYNIQSQQPRNFRTTGFEPVSKHQVSSFQANRISYHHERVMPWVGHTSSDLVDTLTKADAAKYYPYAWPTEPIEITVLHDPMCFAFKKTQMFDKGDDKLDSWFYSGQRRFASMVIQYEGKKNEMTMILKSDLGPIRQQTTFPPVELTQVSVIDMNKKSLSECAAPMIDGLFFTLLEYSERQSSGSRAL